MIITRMQWPSVTFIALPVASAACYLTGTISLPVVADVVGKDTTLPIGLVGFALIGIWYYLSEQFAERKRADDQLTEQRDHSDRLERIVKSQAILIRKLADPNVQNTSADVHRALADLEVDIQQLDLEKAARIVRLAKDREEAKKRSPIKSLLLQLFGIGK